VPDRTTRVGVVGSARGTADGAYRATDRCAGERGAAGAGFNRRAGSAP